MLTEIPSARQNRNHLTRRWFADADFDLYVFTQDDVLVRIELSYDKQADEHMLCWDRTSGYTHHRVDAGDDNPGKAKSPILEANGEVDFGPVLKRFVEAADRLDLELFETVYQRLVEWRYRLT